MKSILRNYLVNILVILLFTGLALWLALKDNAAEVLKVLQHVNIGMALLIVGVVLFQHLCVGWILQQYALFVRKDYRLIEGFKNALVAAFFHGITPSASGGQIAQAFVFHKQGIPVERSASILVIDFIVYQFTMLFISFVLLILRYHYFADNSFFLLALLGFGMNLAVILILILCTFSPKVYTWVSHRGISILYRFHFIKDKQNAIESLNGKLDSFAKGIKMLRKNQLLLCKVALANAVRLLTYFSIPILCCYALQIEVPSGSFITMIALTSFVTNVNAFIPIPGASGGTESVFVLMYAMVLSRVEASSVMVLWRFATYHLVMIIGAIVFIQIQNSKTKVVEKEMEL